MKTKNTDLGLLLLRLALGITMLFYGINKLLYGADFIRTALTDMGLPGIFYYGVFVGEIIAPLLLLLGYKTRIAALIFSFNMLCALLMMKMGLFFSLNNSGGWAIDLIVIYILGGLVLYFTGSGKYALSSKSAWD
ncbi:MAG: DoxX family protein [Bacteroidetes bacterium]|nr:MAG: DoxX family protein [Bacteroidota bacterium]